MLFLYQNALEYISFKACTRFLCVLCIILQGFLFEEFIPKNIKFLSKIMFFIVHSNQHQSNGSWCVLI